VRRLLRHERIKYLFNEIHRLNHLCCSDGRILASERGEDRNENVVEVSKEDMGFKQKILGISLTMSPKASLSTLR
jgi:hypothetical protein